MASHPNWHMFVFISPIICVVTASIFVVVADPSSLCTCVLDHCQWLLLLLLLLLLAFFLREKRSSSSSLTSFVVPERKYEVFLSFRGTDTRYGFLSHLCGALNQKKVDYFLDDQNLQQGSEISPALVTAIEQSEICLVIFSEDYASSAWCLEELAHIIECMKNHNQIVIPVFYKVDPSSVRYQKGSYRDAFAEHEKRFDKHKIQKWRDVLKKAADLSGFHSLNYKTEADFITEVVQCVLKKLNITSHHDDLKGLVGIQERITHLETLLRKKSQNVFVIGIWGTGGIGKTTIAEVLFKRLYNEYEGRCFLHIRQGLVKHGTIWLKEKLFSKLLGEDLDIVINNGILPDCGRRLRRKKVLVVLDDINKLMQLEMLVGRFEWFGSDSRIIVTSRDRDVIKMCDFIYEVNQLNSEEALQLFNLNALPEICLDKKHEWYELSKPVVEYAKGNPLAIKVLGSSLYGRNKIEWKSKLNKLNKILDPEIQDVLQLSYDDLDDEQKDIFLYLACFFREDSKERIISLLDDYHIIDGLRVLQNRALITIWGGEIVFMYNLIRKMGCEIVRRKCPKNSGRRNHLWDSDDIYEVFKNNKGTEEIESISLQMSRLKRDIHLRPQALARMDNLKLLRIEADYPLWIKKVDHMVYVPEEDIILPNKLRSFHWDLYPSKSFPLRFCVDNLVELRFTRSCLQKLWDGIQELPSLKVIDLSWSKEFIELPDLSMAPNLEYLFLIGCDMFSHVPLWPKHNMVEIDSTECEECKKISLGSQASITSLSIEGSEKDDHLDLCGTSLPIKPSFKYFVLPSLQVLSLKFCKSLTGLPDNIGLYLPSLQMLDLWGANVETLPASIKHLSQLKVLCLIRCSRLRYIPELPPSIEYLNAIECRSLQTLQFSSNSVPLSHQKNILRIVLHNCLKLDDQKSEAVARYYKLTTERIISANTKYSHVELCIPRRKVLECFSSYRVTQDSVSVPLELPLHSKAMGFIFYFVLENESSKYGVEIISHIELKNAPQIQFSSYDPFFGILTKCISDHAFLWYENSLSLKIMDEVSRMKASATTDDLYARVWFELDCPDVKEWGVYPIFMSSEPKDLTNTKKMSRY